MDKAIYKNKLESVKWIHENTTIGCSRDGIRSAYNLDDSKMIEWLHQNRTEEFDGPLKVKFNELSKQIQSFIIHNKRDMIPSDVLNQIKDDPQHTNLIIESIKLDSLKTVGNLNQ